LGQIITVAAMKDGEQAMNSARGATARDLSHGTVFRPTFSRNRSGFVTAGA
jgi:hypothetical protein